MKVSASFSGKEIENVSLDFSKLREEGLEYIQKLSGDIWTDYNSHDPGVTILEQLIYTLTDLAYRTSLPIEELLSTDKKPFLDKYKNAFFDPKGIIGSHPVTVADTRKMIIDKFDEIQNVWMITRENLGYEEQLSGVNQIEILPKIKFLKSLNDSKSRSFLKKVNHYLNEIRNIGECYSEAKLLKPQLISIDFNIYLNDQVDLPATIAKVFFKLHEYIYSPIQYSSLDEMKEAGFSMEEIYSGPNLNRGTIKDFSEKQRLTVIHIDELQKLLTSVEGILTCIVKGFKINGESKNFITTDPCRFFHLLNEDSSDNFIDNRFGEIYKNMTVYVNKKELKDFNRQKINNLFTEAWSKTHRGNPIAESTEELSFSDKTKSWQNLKVYDSLQKHFPIIYGIGEEGLSKHEPEERKAKAQQLKAYLLLFEQHFANHLAQLGSLNDFFNIDYNTGSQRTYFSQLLDSKIVPGYDALVDDRINEMESYLETVEIRFDRKNRIYDHLLARFGEELNEIPWKVSRHLQLISNENEYQQTVLRQKSEFLKQLESLSYSRTKGENLIPDHSENYNRIPSGLEEIIRIKTGIKTGKKSKIDKSFIHKYKIVYKAFEDIKNKKTLFKETLKYKNYRIQKPDSQTDNAQVEFRKDENNWIKIVDNQTVSDVGELIECFRKLNYQSEKIYIVDHILLRDFLKNSKCGFSYFDENGNSLLHTLENESWLDSTESNSLDSEARNELFRHVTLQRKHLSYDNATWTINYEKWEPIAFSFKSKDFSNLENELPKGTYAFLNGKWVIKVDGKIKALKIENTKLEKLNKVFDDVFFNTCNINSPLTLALYRKFYFFENACWTIKYGGKIIASHKIKDEDLQQIQHILEKQAYFFKDGKWQIRFDEKMMERYEIEELDLKAILKILIEENYFYEDETWKIKHDPKMLACFSINKEDLQIITDIIGHEICIFDEGKWKIKHKNKGRELCQINQDKLLKIIDVLDKHNSFFEDENWKIKYESELPERCTMEDMDLQTIIDILNHQSCIFEGGKWKKTENDSTRYFINTDKENRKKYFNLLNKRRSFFFEKNAQKFISDYDTNLKTLNTLFENVYKKNKSILQLFDNGEDGDGRLRFMEMEKIRFRGSKHSKSEYFEQRRLVFQRKLSDELETTDDLKIINEDFFNLNISVILPDWPARFQEEQFKDYVTELIHERTPAYIGNNIFWVDFVQMKSFERTYKRWKKEKAISNDSQNPSKGLMQAAFEVFKVIHELKQNK